MTPYADGVGTTDSNPSPTPPEPTGLDDGSAAALLDEAEEILNPAGSTIRAEVEAEQTAKPNVFKRLFGRKR